MRYIALILALYVLSRFCHHQTAGFSMAKIEHNDFPMQIDATPLKLEGKFHYLGRGLQSFSFLSEDGKMVLKIFNNRYQNKLFWLQLCPQLDWVQKKSAIAKTKLERNFRSYQIAFEQMKEETGLLYFHPAPTTDLCQTVILVDKLGIEHLLDLDNTAFLVQKKATLFYPYIQLLMEKNELSKAKEALLSFIALVKARCDKGIGNNDALVRTNFGFIDHQPVQIDVGPFYRDDALKEAENSRREVRDSTLNLKHWLEAHYPPLASYYSELIEHQ